MSAELWTVLIAYVAAFAFVAISETLKDPIEGETFPVRRLVIRGALLGTLLAFIGVLAVVSISMVAVFFVIWWTVLFAVLPFGARSQAEAQSVIPGTEPAAPVRPLLLKKVIATTLIASVIFAIFYYVRFESGLTLDDIPFQRELRY